MSERFGFNAMEMTTEEIITSLLLTKDKESIKELHEILETSDLVKFAKFNPPMNEKDRNLLNAIDFVNSTKPAAEEEEEQPKERKIVDKRSQREKNILLLSIIALSAIAVILLVLLICELYNLYN